MTENLCLPVALIFDLDGVLVDSEPLHRRAKEQALAEIGIVLPESVYDDLKGRPDEIGLREIVQKKGVSDSFPQLIERKSQLYREIQHDLREVAGAAVFVGWAKSHFRLALATSSTPRNREVALGVLRVGDLFESIVDSGRHQRAKPNPEVFQIAMRDLGLSPAECWIVEDSVNGLRAAKSAGCFAVGITTTFAGPILKSAGADIVVESFRELRHLIETEFAAAFKRGD
ncbi:MAG TPA: HAD family phosphatase [Candidatus Sulfotelmatobacter sp.]|jgi:HAD superfamily hydrolase (TIGR01549 family)|nr:HAD family phosphatase [Candidatus Sulfotelmatobacter sp.]